MISCRPAVDAQPVKQNTTSPRTIPAVPSFFLIVGNLPAGPTASKPKTVAALRLTPISPPPNEMEVWQFFAVRLTVP
jgi:hypothetical protein